MPSKRNNGIHSSLAKVAALFNWRDTRTIPISNSVSSRIDDNITKAKVTVPRSVTKKELTEARDSLNDISGDNYWEDVTDALPSLNPVLQKGPVTLSGNYSGLPYSLGVDTHGKPLFLDDRFAELPETTFPYTGPSGRKHNWTISGENGSPLVVEKMTPDQIEDERRYREELDRYIQSRLYPQQGTSEISSTEGAIANAIRGGAFNSPESYRKLLTAINGLDRDTLLRLRAQNSDLSAIPEEYRDEYRALLNSAAQKPYRDRGMTYNEAEYMLLGDDLKNDELTDLVTRDLGHSANSVRDNALMSYLSNIRVGQGNNFRDGGPEVAAARAIAQIRDAEVAELKRQLHDRFYGPDAVLSRGSMGGPTADEMIAAMGLEGSAIPMKKTPERIKAEKAEASRKEPYWLRTGSSSTRHRPAFTGNEGMVRDEAAIRNMFRGWLDQQIYESDAFNSSLAAKKRLKDLERALAEQKEFYRRNPRAGGSVVPRV